MRQHMLFCAASALALSLPSLAQAQSSNTPPPTIRVQRVPATPVARPAVISALRAVPVTQTEITPPPEVQTRAPANSVTLRSGPNSAMVRALPIKRQIAMAQVRAAPSIMIGATRVNMAPTLANPRALFNVAQRIRERPNLADVLTDDTRAYEVDQGLILRSFLTYRVKPGVCTDARRGALSSTGLSCASSLTDAARTAAFANPRDPHYVPDPAARARAIQEARTKGALIDADLTAQVANVRAALADPARRPEFDAQLGPEQAARLTTMTDDQIKSEIVNSGETSIEQTLFVPRLDKVDPAFAQKFAIKNVDKPKSPDAPMLLGGLMVKPGINPGLLAGAMAPKPDTKVSTPIQTRIFLTGFTLGREYEWKERIEKTIKTCLVSCKKTYYVEVFAGFNYGFGLRFPMKLDGTYSFHATPDGKTKTAKVQTNFVPVNGDASQYLATGLPSEKLFGGKELVAQVGAHAGAGFKLPFVGSNSIDIPVGVDFTEYLPGDFYLGQFTPPAPGGTNNPKAEKVFYDLDLIGGRANFGVIGAQVFPAVRVELTSDQLTFKLHDFVSNADTLLTNSGQVTNLAIDSKNQSRFSIGDPKYNVAFLITPGLTARLFVDLAVWSHNWDFPVWFPQLALKLPPDGYEFSCHEGTECSRAYTYSPTGYSDMAGAEGGIASELQTWGQGFDARHIENCADENCQFAIKLVRQGTIFGALHKWDANKALKITDFAQDFIKADMQAQEMIGESNVRKTKDISKDYREIYRAIWMRRCSDAICLDKIKGISSLHMLEINAQQKQNPGTETNPILIAVLKKFTPIYQAEIDASKARLAAEQAAASRRAMQIKPIGATINGTRPPPLTPRP